ncbi:MAG: uroporphyrinogen decarboxylase family protein [Mahellales bacterium]|jgi:uroporphyrinogen decarboxylase
MSQLTSRERVRMALNHKEPDKVPIDFGAMRSTGISAMGYNKLKEYLGIKGGHTKVYDILQQLAEPELEVLKIMEGDVIQLHRLEPAFGINRKSWKPGKLPDGSDCLVPEGFNPVRNEKGDLEILVDGIPVGRMPEGGFYFDVVHHPYENVQTKADIDKLPVPVITDEELEFLRAEAKKMYEETDYAILGAFGGNIFEQGQFDWGYVRYYTELALNPELIHYYHQRLADAYVVMLERYLGAVGEYIDVIQFGDDLGTQQNPQISVDMYRKMIKPYHKVQYQYVQQHYPNVKVFIHCCGSIYDLIPDLIDAGVQVLNPVQLSARNMDPVKLKKEFGKDLVFWGGGCNTQTTATFGTVEDIKEEVERYMKIFAPGGGFVFTQIHNIQANVSPEKVMAIYETAKKLRNYPVK